MTNLISGYFALGQWDEVERVFAEIPEEGRIATNAVQASAILDLAQIAFHRGEADRVVELAGDYTGWDDATHVQVRGVGVWARVLVAQAEGRHAEALAACIEALRSERAQELRFRFWA